MEIITVPCLDASQAAVLWECVHEHSQHSRVAVLDEEGATYALVEAQEALLVSEARIRASSIEPRQVGTLSCGFRLNPSLTSVILPGVSLRDAGATALARNLADCAGLLSLDIGENSLRAPGCSAVSEALSAGCSSLTSVRLAWNCLGMAGFEALGSMFRHCRKLRSLDLTSTMPGEGGLVAMAESLATSSLTNLELTFADTVGRGGAALGKVLCENSGLTRLDIWDMEPTGEGTAAVLSSMRRMTSLQSLVLIKQREPVAPERGAASAAWCQELGSVVSRNAGLKGLVLSGYSAPVALALGASCEGLERIMCGGEIPEDRSTLEPLSRALCGPNMKHLVHSGGKSSGLGLVLEEAARTGISINPDVMSLGIWGDSLEATGRMLHLASFVRHCTALTLLLLRKSSITTEGGMCLTGVVSRNVGSLTEFDLAHNCLGSSWAAEVSPHLSACSLLVNLNLPGNKLGMDGVVSVISCASRLYSLQMLDLSDNEQGDFPFFDTTKGELEVLSLLRESTALTDLSVSGGSQLPSLQKKYAKGLSECRPHKLPKLPVSATTPWKFHTLPPGYRWQIEGM